MLVFGRTKTPELSRAELPLGVRNSVATASGVPPSGGDLLFSCHDWLSCQLLASRCRAPRAAPGSPCGGGPAPPARTSSARRASHRRSRPGAPTPARPSPSGPSRGPPRRPSCRWCGQARSPPPCTPSGTTDEGGPSFFPFHDGHPFRAFAPDRGCPSNRVRPSDPGYRRTPFGDGDQPPRGDLLPKASSAVTGLRGVRCRSTSDRSSSRCPGGPWARTASPGPTPELGTSCNPRNARVRRTQQSALSPAGG